MAAWKNIEMILGESAFYGNILRTSVLEMKRNVSSYNCAIKKKKRIGIQNDMHDSLDLEYVPFPQRFRRRWRNLPSFYLMQPVVLKQEIKQLPS